MSWQPEPADWPTLKRPDDDANEHVRDLLPTYLNGTLDPSEIGRVAVHIERCAGCRAALGSWERIALAVRADAADRDLPPARPLDRALAAIGDPGSLAGIAEHPSTHSLAEPRLPDLPVTSRDQGERALDRPMMTPDVIGKPVPVRPSRVPAVRRRPIVSELSSAAVLVLVLAGVVAAFRLAPDDDQRTVPGAATDATPPAGSSLTVLGPDDAVNLAECSIEARPVGGVAALIGTEAGSAPVLPDPQGEVDAPPGPEPPDPNSYVAGLPRADDGIRAGIEETLREMAACRFYALVPDSGPTPRRGGHDSRYMALFSDDFFRRYAVDDALIPSPRSFGYVVGGGWVPSGPFPAVLGDTRELPDGRILALIQPASFPFQFLIVFARSADRWLVDEINLVQPRNPSVLATPAALGPQSLPIDVALWDDTATWNWPANTDPFDAAEGVTISAANLGTHLQRVEIQPLGYVVVVQPGQSVDLLLELPTGTYRVRSFLETVEGPPEPVFDADLVLIDEATPTAGD